MKKVNHPLTAVPSGLNERRQQSVLNASGLLTHEAIVQKLNTHEPDAELIEEFRLHRNEKAFEELYRRYKSPMLAYLYGILHNWEDAKDVLHNAWEAVLQSFSNDRYSEEQDFAGWFKSICYRQASLWLRERNKFLYGSGSLPDHADTSLNVEQALVISHDKILLHKAINRLPENEKQLIILRHFENMSFYEIAVIRHITVGAARSRYCKALKKLRIMLS